ncbi:MAG TPA: M23 family metallopeptidase [Blastocatellia bacterium]|jgi:murein DD-endopeptidase MepM/ murein hydrolase activator NlpD|nr:M23 family metallopeptidase [Blastocatellia bacterium]
MPDDNRFYTFLIATTETSKVRRISIHHSLLYIAGALLTVIVFVIIVSAFRLTQHEALNLRFLSVKAENETLKKENDAYENSYAKLKGQISYIEDMSKELARQARMERVTEIDQQVGTGGPETVAGLDRAADQLERDVRQINDRMRSDLLRLASIPAGLPINGYVTDGFGIRSNPFSGESREVHEGLDIAADFGTPVSSTADGLVIWAAPHGGYGNLVIVFHSNGITTRYGHLSKITVEPGQRVKRGEQVGHVGSTGRSTGPHVHYEIRVNDQSVDPLRYADQQRP